mmetsp:Transcript_22049/g.16451  ORF Transcript_22049/g.16451 Transcript_22049/m.16451 type:complete len:120 (+) Transcript_22049:844-1203(+)
MLSELLAAGIHNHLKAGTDIIHPLGTVLLPTIEGLIGYNHFAVPYVFNPVYAPFTQDTLNLGTRQGMDLIGKHFRSEFDFYKLAPDMDLKARGFLDFEGVESVAPAFDIKSEIEKAKSG